MIASDICCLPNGSASAWLAAGVVPARSAAVSHRLRTQILSVSAAAAYPRKPSMDVKSTAGYVPARNPPARLLASASDRPAIRLRRRCIATPPRFREALSGSGAHVSPVAVGAGRGGPSGPRGPRHPGARAAHRQLVAALTHVEPDWRRLREEHLIRGSLVAHGLRRLCVLSPQRFQETTLMARFVHTSPASAVADAASNSGNSNSGGGRRRRRRRRRGSRSGGSNS